MNTRCECTLGRLVCGQEIGKINEQLKAAGAPLVEGEMLAQIAEFSPNRNCPCLHRVDEKTGYCSCEEFIADWVAELGESAGLKDGKPL